MSGDRLADYMDHMRQAARDAGIFIEGMSKQDFLTDKRTQQAVMMNLLIIREAATKIMESRHDFVKRHPKLPWREMRGMRNRIPHGYFDINLDVVWDTLNTALPELLARLATIE